MILGIESSCDDSSVALIDINTYEKIYYKKISQELEHSKYGGVVPELAARLHTQALPNLIIDIKPHFKNIKAIAVTNEPGLSVSLIGGVSLAKAISISLNIPLIGINHLFGHIYSLFLDKDIVFPLGVLLVSGGHTMIIDIDCDGKISVLATTSDDSFGESFDKVAKMLNLGYPGGEKIENLAKDGDDKRFHFTIPLLHNRRLEYSFSGLKNQVRLEIEKMQFITEQDRSDICACFQKTAINHILDKLSKIFVQKKWAKFGIVGGASANLSLRNGVFEICKKHDSSLLLAPLEFCSDNALMIARAGISKFKKREFIDYKNLQINPKIDFLNFNR
ncbi:tRNA (adenosine(37)-N6)-threonylcarbamoyltransferase complex transferase subunit TsaD [Campylobacter portucalensis]|uniref:tRNA (adenosine(37)-N6)-threonylcarbamoyltransferase complex transferase subunit TsaD n=1 Tax=Campylobacter portucalensis TaxID=2608384 RepID=UPI0018A6C4EA|nr:tRNA (adenosine(37)-N6)-threonylcarbamoyltransferase complex transferase subunit TsaD [Campylobacter portucalensis]